MYITDRIEIQIRSGTGLEYRVLGRVKTGDRVEVLEGDRNWSRIKLSDGTAGWINTTFLVDQIKAGSVGDPKLQEELQENKETLQALSREKEMLVQEKTRLTKEAEEAKILAQTLQQEKMKRISPELSALQTKNEQLEKEIAQARKQISEVSGSQKGPWLGEHLTWFLIGSLVLLAGLILGLLLSRGQRKTRRYY
jgi:SH3 domain protein